MKINNNPCIKASIKWETEFNRNNKHFILDEDKPFIDKIKKNNNLHLELLPHPFCGDVENGQVYFLLLNPGVDSPPKLDDTNDKYFYRKFPDLFREELKIIELVYF